MTAPAFCSWSGGKDSWLALARARAVGLEPDALLTMLTEDGSRTRSHGLRVEVVEEQAAALGLRLVTRRASWAGYEPAFAGALRQLRGDGIVAGIFGDIDVEDHRGWIVRVCASAGIEPALPLWREERLALLHELMANETEAQVVAVRDGLVPPRLLGRVLDRALVVELETLGIDPCGEGGEYHTVVVDARDFARRLDLRRGAASLRDGVWFLDLRLDSEGCRPAVRPSS